VGNIPILVTSLHVIINLCTSFPGDLVSAVLPATRNSHEKVFELDNNQRPDTTAKNNFCSLRICDVILKILEKYKDFEKIIALAFQCVAALCSDRHLPNIDSFTSGTGLLQLVFLLQDNKDEVLVVKDAVLAIEVIAQAPGALSKLMSMGILDVIHDIVDRASSNPATTELVGALSASMSAISNLTRDCSEAHATLLVKMLQTLQRIAASPSIKSKDIKTQALDAGEKLRLKINNLSPSIVI